MLILCNNISSKEHLKGLSDARVCLEKLTSINRQEFLKKESIARGICLMGVCSSL
jgi:hypothetical protein